MPSDEPWYLKWDSTTPLLSDLAGYLAVRRRWQRTTPPFSGDTLLCCSYLSSAFVSGQILELFPRDHLARLAGFLQALSLIPRPLLKLAGKTLPLEGLAGSWHLSVKYPSVPRRRASTGRSPTSAATTCTTVCWTQACVPRRGLDLAKFGRSGAETVLRCARQPWGGPSSP